MKLITFETAQLAQTVRFDQLGECEHYYGSEDGTLNCIDGQRPISAGYQSELQKWLREEHNMHVCSDLSIVVTEGDAEAGKWMCRVDNIIKNDYLYHSEDNSIRFDTYEEALEKGLQEALKLI